MPSFCFNTPHRRGLHRGHPPPPGQVHSFEGFRLDMSKAVTPTFFTSHNVFFGNPQFPTGHYQVGGYTLAWLREKQDTRCPF